MKISATVISRRSRPLPVLTAETTPIGIPIDSHRMTAPTVRKIVFGSRLRISGSTSVWFW